MTELISYKSFSFVTFLPFEGRKKEWRLEWKSCFKALIHIFFLTSSQSPSIVSTTKRRLKSLEEVKTAVEE